MTAKLAVKLHLDPCGIKNKGNTCFFNASIQCFLSLPKIVRYFLENSFDPSRQPFCLAFQNFIFEYKNNSKILDPSDFIGKIRGKIRLFDGKQQDAHSFLDGFISKLCDELDSCKDTRDSNIVKQALSISVEDKVKCQKCGFVSVVSSHPTMQYLTIRDSVQRSLNHYLENEERVDESSPWKCTECSAKTACPIVHSIRSTSDYFIVYLNRFQSLVSKNNTQITIDQNININDIKYEAVGVACHSGVLDGGHYYAFCKRDKWMEYNDSLVQPIERPEHSSSAYMIFYSRT